MRTIAIAVVPLLAGLVCAQDSNRTETRTTTTRTTWNGALVDAACQTTRTERTDSTVGGVRTQTQTTTTESNNCPVTSATTTFGILTRDGHFVPFDNSSNARVVEIVRTRNGFIPSDRGPLWVNVSGTANGNYAVVETIDAGGSAVTVADTQRVDGDIMFDVTHDGDRGKLIVGTNRVTFDDVSNASHSRSWSYAEIKEFKRDGRQIKIEGHHGDSHDFKTEDRAMSDAIYNTISARLVAARNR